MAATFTNAGSQWLRPDRAHSACTSLSATPTPARFLSGYAQSWRFGLMTASALRQLRVGLVMVGDDQIEAERPGVSGRLDAADAAVDRDDQTHVLGGAGDRATPAAVHTRRAGAPG